MSLIQQERVTMSSLPYVDTPLGSPQIRGRGFLSSPHASHRRFSNVVSVVRQLVRLLKQLDGSIELQYWPVGSRPVLAAMSRP